MKSSELFSKLKKLEPTDRVLLLTHTDADGAGPEILLRYTIGSKNLTVKHLNNGIMSREIRNAVCSSDANDYDTIIACDISCSKGDAKAIAASENAAKLVILDHHLTSSHLNEYPFGISYHGMVSDSFRAPLFKNCPYDGLSSGTSLMYDYLHYINLVDTDRDDNEFGNKDAILREIVHLIATYDTWDWVNCFKKNPRYLKFNRLFDIYGNDHYVSIMLKKAFRGSDETACGFSPVMESNIGNAYLFDSIDEFVLEIDADKRKLHLEQVKDSIQTGFIVLNNYKYSLVYVNNTKYSNDVFEMMKQLYPDTDLYVINYGSGVSVRSMKNSINVAEIVSHYNGGGHLGAGGFKIPMTNIIEMLCKTMNADIIFDTKE